MTAHSREHGSDLTSQTSSGRAQQPLSLSTWGQFFQRPQQKTPLAGIALPGQKGSANREQGVAFITHLKGLPCNNTETYTVVKTSLRGFGGQKKIHLWCLKLQFLLGEQVSSESGRSCFSNSWVT